MFFWTSATSDASDKYEVWRGHAKGVFRRTVKFSSLTVCLFAILFSDGFYLLTLPCSQGNNQNFPTSETKKLLKEASSDVEIDSWISQVNENPLGWIVTKCFLYKILPGALYCDVFMFMVWIIFRYKQTRWFLEYVKLLFCLIWRKFVSTNWVFWTVSVVWWGRHQEFWSSQSRVGQKLPKFKNGEVKLVPRYGCKYFIGVDYKIYK